MCRNCGAIVGAGEDECAVCGALAQDTSPVQQSRVIADRETIRFARAVLSRPYKFTIVLLILNFFVFLMMWESSGMTLHALWEIPEHVLVAYGAKVNSWINEKHQWWRFVTPIFIHVNLPHVLVNMYSLWMVGPYVEKLYGSARFVVFWVVTGLAGVTASYLTVVDSGPPMGSLGRFLLKTQDVPSAGASGALFGLVGVLFVFGIKFRHELPEGFKRAFGTGMLPIILINLFIGYVGRGFIDNAAHLGGLISGAALAVAVQYRRPGERASIKARWYVLEAAAILLVLVSFFKVAQHFRDPENVGSMRPGMTSVERRNAFVLYSLALHKAQEKLNLALKGDVAGVDEAANSLDSVPHLDPRADELRIQLKDLLLRAKNHAATTASHDEQAGKAAVGQSPVPKEESSQSEPNALVEDVKVWKRDHNNWLKTTGRHY
ncbi:MAG TPA: rhomboid family intramembrane serine protease [Pyrinomonadaceae bacterium]|nr:rhomboid family intramembrane serine protease [Pyrinomonadaceae bacterium]